jgi:hypothetical protein
MIFHNRFGTQKNSLFSSSQKNHCYLVKGGGGDDFPGGTLVTYLWLIHNWALKLGLDSRLSPMDEWMDGGMDEFGIFLSENLW